MRRRSGNRCRALIRVPSVCRRPADLLLEAIEALQDDRHGPVIGGRSCQAFCCCMCIDSVGRAATRLGITE